MSAGSMGDKIVEADKLMSKANKHWSPSLLDFRLKPDWEGAAPLFEKAAMLYKVSCCVAAYKHAHCLIPLLTGTFAVLQQVGQLEKSRTAYERAAQSQEKIGSIWHAAKHLETCGAISKELNQPDKMADFYRQAGNYFAQAGRVSAGAWRRCCFFPMRSYVCLIAGADRPDTGNCGCQ